jgi:hypothetical protein
VTFWELFGALMSAAGLLVGGLGLVITYAARKNGEATRALIGSTQDETRALIRILHEEKHTATRELIRTMEERLGALLERMDQRADERHREMVQLIQTLRPSGSAG